MHSLIRFTGLLLIAASCQSSDSDKKQNLDEASSKVSGYTVFETEPYHAVVVKCDIGRLKLNIMPYHISKMEVHRSYQKYVHFEPKGDTLYILTENTPRRAEGDTVRKVINLYCPSLKFLETNASKVLIKDFEEDNLTIVNKSSSLRLSNSIIQNLYVDNQGLSSSYLSVDNAIQDLHVRLNPKSSYRGRAIVTRSFKLESKSLDNTNFLNVIEDGFKWIRN